MDEKVVSITERICLWTYPAYASEVFLEGLAADFLSVFETRASFGLRSFFEAKISREGLPQEVKEEFDHSTKLSETGEINLEN